MMLGAVIWGYLADKVGRKTTLITSLSVNAVFAIIGAFVPSYWLFLLCRFFSGVGIGGSIPIVMAYYGEFCSKSGRGWKLGLLLMFWAFGGVYVSAMGWIVIPNKDIQLALTEGHTLHSWRVFILICIIPIILSLLGLLGLPESPRYLLQVGRDLDALAVYRKVYLYNHTEAGAEYEMPEIELPSRTAERPDDCGGTSVGQCEAIAKALENFWNSFFQLFFTPLTMTTCILCGTWFSTAFGYYGLSIWFPEYIKKLEQEVYFSETHQTQNTSIANTIFTGLLDNDWFYNSTFSNVTFRDIELRHVTFEMCHVINCVFLNVTSKKTFFLESIITDSLFNDTDFHAYKFQGTLFKDTEFYNEWEGCEVDFDISYSNKQVFLENFLSQLAVVPTTLGSALLMDKIGRVPLLAGCLFVAAISVFFIWFTNTEVAVVCINAVFNCFINGAFNSIDVTSMELYPTHLRTTAFGFLSCLGRIAAILGNVAFGSFIAASKAIPILLTAAILAVGGVLSLKLPESKNKML